jgi:DNA gyrase/topoisomerase IV subunit A
MALTQTTASEYILNSSKEYSIYVCQNRAIPSIIDGLKDGQRKALWVMRNKSEKIKVISLAGLLISENLYLHGDQSAAGAISMLAAPFCNNVPLLEGIGSFGTRVAPVEGIGAARYIYVKKNKASEYLLFRDLDVVPLKDNYDGSTKEPEYFLPLIPTVLLNGVSGIAVGWSTEILPRSLNDLIQATIDALDGKKIKKITPKYEYLDLLVNNYEGNIWEFSGKAEIVDTSTIKITELPPDMTLERLKERLNTLEDEDKISSYTDRSTGKIDVLVRFKRGSIRGWDNDKLIDFFKLKQRKTERLVVIDWNGSAIKQYENAELIINDFVEWRLGYYTKRYEKLLADASYELQYWLGLEACFKSKLPEDLLKFSNKQQMVDKVKEITVKLKIDNDQIDKIATISSFKWAKDYYNEVKIKISELKNNIAEHKSIISDPKKIREIYRQELLELKKVKFK